MLELVRAEGGQPYPHLYWMLGDSFRLENAPWDERHRTARELVSLGALEGAPSTVDSMAASAIRDGYPDTDVVALLHALPEPYRDSSWRSAIRAATWMGNRALFRRLARTERLAELGPEGAATLVSAACAAGPDWVGYVRRRTGSDAPLDCNCVALGIERGQDALVGSGGVPASCVEDLQSRAWSGDRDQLAAYEARLGPVSPPPNALPHAIFIGNAGLVDEAVRRAADPTSELRELVRTDPSGATRPNLPLVLRAIAGLVDRGADPHAVPDADLARHDGEFAAIADAVLTARAGAPQPVPVDGP